MIDAADFLAQLRRLVALCSRNHPDGLRLLRRSSKCGADDGLCFRKDTVQVISSSKALGIYFVDVFGARRTRRNPSAGGDHLQTSDGGTVARSLGDDAL